MSKRVSDEQRRFDSAMIAEILNELGYAPEVARQFAQRVGARKVGDRWFSEQGYEALPTCSRCGERFDPTRPEYRCTAGTPMQAHTTDAKPPGGIQLVCVVCGARVDVAARLSAGGWVIPIDERLDGWTITAPEGSRCPECSKP